MGLLDDLFPEDEDSYEDEENSGWEEADTDVGDREAGKSRLCSTMCGTCLFKPPKKGRLLGITNRRVKGIIDEAVRSDSYIVCHATIGTPTPAICRGFYERYSTNALRIMARLFGFVEIDPPVCP